MAGARVTEGAAGYDDGVNRRVAAVVGAAALVLAVVLPAAARQLGPTPAQLAATSLQGAVGQKSVHVALTGTISATLGAKAPALFARLAGKPLTFSAEGDLSAGAASLDASLGLAGMSLPVKLVLDGTRLYVNVLGAWYGSDKLAPDRTHKAAGSEAALLQSIAGLVVGTVADGPTVDGAATWQLAGTFDAAAAAKLVAERTGKPLPAKSAAALQTIAGSSSFTLLNGKSDGLARRVSAELHLSPAAVQSLAAASTGTKAGSAAGALESLDLRVQGDFSRWGAKVLVAPPKAFQPLSRLRAALAAFGSAH